MNNNAREVATGPTAEQRQRARAEAADILTWGGPRADTHEQSRGNLPAHWHDVTETVLAALDEVRNTEKHAEEHAQDHAD